MANPKLYALVKSGQIKVHLLSHPELRFWKNVDKDGPTHPDFGKCWIWLASKSHNGYGQIVTFGKSNRSHRYSYEIHIGEIPKGLYVLHKCDNPSCVNPSHLFLGTTLENQRDKVTKNRQAKGETIATCKLTEDNIIEIRRRYKLKVGTNHDRVNGQGALAREYGVSQANISIIVRGKGWKYLS